MSGCAAPLRLFVLVGCRRTARERAPDGTRGPTGRRGRGRVTARARSPLGGSVGQCFGQVKGVFRVARVRARALPLASAQAASASRRTVYERWASGRTARLALCAACLCGWWGRYALPARRGGAAAARRPRLAPALWRDAMHRDGVRLDNGVRLHVLAEHHGAVPGHGGDLHRERVGQAGGLHIEGGQRRIGQQAPGPAGGLLALAWPGGRAAQGTDGVVETGLLFAGGQHTPQQRRAAILPCAHGAEVAAAVVRGPDGPAGALSR
ncbi:hypothetical protein ABIE67_000208 [Streptomyces sp. V4I8]